MIFQQQASKIRLGTVKKAGHFLTIAVIFFVSGVSLAIPTNTTVVPKTVPVCHSFDQVMTIITKARDTKLVAAYLHPLNPKMRIAVFATGAGIVSVEDAHKCVYRIKTIDPVSMDFILTKLGLKWSGV